MSFFFFDLFFFFFFKKKPAYEIEQRDWSPDVCSPDLPLSADMHRAVESAARSSGLDESGELAALRGLQIPRRSE